MRGYLSLSTWEHKYSRDYPDWWYKSRNALSYALYNHLDVVHQIECLQVFRGQPVLTVHIQEIVDCTVPAKNKRVSALIGQSIRIRELMVHRSRYHALHRSMSGDSQYGQNPVKSITLQVLCWQLHKEGNSTVCRLRNITPREKKKNKGRKKRAAYRFSRCSGTIRKHFRMACFLSRVNTFCQRFACFVCLGLSICHRRTERQRNNIFRLT